MANDLNLSKVKKCQSWNELFSNILDYKSDTYDLISKKDISTFSYLGEGFFEKNCKMYACSVVAMVNVCIQKGYIVAKNRDGSYNIDKIVNAFKYLWNNSKTKVYATENGIKYGSTNDTDIEPALMSFANAMKGITPITVAISNPIWDRLVDIVNNNLSSVYSMRIYIKKDGGYEVSGHSVNLVGYATYRKKSTKEVVRFLKVVNGWEETTKYLLFDHSRIVSSHVVAI